MSLSTQQSAVSSLYSIYGKIANQPPSFEKKSRYRFGRDLGAGTYGIVKAATTIDGGEQVAIKVILKKNVKGHESMVHEELKLLSSIHHPHIVGFRDWFESKDKYYIVTQLATGGELFDRIVERGKYTEKDAVATIKDVLDAVAYLHSCNIVHRDLKPENLLYLTPAPDSALVLADFGIAKTLASNEEVLTTMAGSFGYAAPEILMKTGHGKPCDIWSLGIITYTLLCGYNPFRSESIQEFLVEVTQVGVVFNHKYWKDVSEDAKDFVRSMLKTDPKERMTAQDLLKHKWISGDTATTNDLLPAIREGFNARSKLLQVLESVRLANKIKALGINIDEDDDDVIPLEAGDKSANSTGSSLDIPKVQSKRKTSFGSHGNATTVFQEVVRAASRLNSVSKTELDH